MGNSANCASCGCGDKPKENYQTVHAHGHDSHTGPPPAAPINSAQPLHNHSNNHSPGHGSNGHFQSGYDAQHQSRYSQNEDNPDSDSRRWGGKDSTLSADNYETGYYHEHPHEENSTHGNEAHSYDRVEKLADGSIFEGQFLDRERHGWGKFSWHGGGSYEGQFNHNDMHGEGTYTWSDGSTYSGQWQRNNMGPHGVMQWTDGRKYEGQFVGGKKHGEGQLVWLDGRMYTGQWEAGKQHGCGVTVTGKGVSRKSQWAHGKLIRWLDDGAPLGDCSDVGGTGGMHGKN